MKDFTFYRNFKDLITTTNPILTRQAFFCKKPILSSNSWPGPVELINHLENGFVFENKNLESFIQKFRDFDNYKDLRLITLNGLKTSKKFTLFSHYKNLNKLLSIN